MTRARFILSALLAAMTMLAAALHPAFAEDQRSAGGMLAWPREEMVRALGIYVPERMKRFDVPGASIAIVADGSIIYSATFGKADRGSDTPVTPATLFEAGEIGETVAAYAALGLVQDKLLFLDAPLSRDLSKPWLKNADDSRLVTLRQVLTHTSGLPDNAAHPSRSTRFAPGTRFSHSAVGFLYLQHAMEAVSGERIGEVMSKRVFEPLGMKSSGFVIRTADRANLARGYVPLSFPVLLFYLPFGASALLVLALVWGVVRFGLQRRIEPGDLLWPLTAGLVFAVSVVWYGLGLAHGAFVIATSVGYALAVGLLGGVIYYIFRLVGVISSRDGVISRGPEASEGTALGYSLALAFAISLLFFEWMLGVPRFSRLGIDSAPNVARSFRTNAGDMAHFMIGFMDGKGVGEALRARMVAERVEVDPPYGWGLGIGIRTDASGETLWARGSRMGFESLMVMDPARRAGVIVLTNSREGSALAQDVARNVFGLNGSWTLP